ncbi:hypothetical protein NFHSH190041_37130 (plasmid) [Shewanella sp. NFH-SH190041]|uniref:hypothetical protein n=1 Tax=Shewanella sp. NFH-SH190041 TaxID=2950245 RepID=UPI0021C2A8E2|nr:hypothetical protein [Shewanella sp. NFH-SH190041]BDM66261.1 hypothetical protein NFHSH190041_37130 [Shewanella sp. NFH-SH190041]
MATEYRKNKKQIYGCFLSSEDAAIVLAAIEKAAKKTGVTNNRKNRLALLEMARHYNETT